MKEHVEILEEAGITADTVIVASRRGLETEGHPSSWKLYYRLAADPSVGVLLGHVDDNNTIVQRRRKLDDEAKHSQTLREKGYDVPGMFTPSVEVIDHLMGGTTAAAMLVEHIEGVGPYKATTQYPTIAKIVANKPAVLQPRYCTAWAELTQAAAGAAPRDLQVIIESSGRFVTIDTEQLGPGVNLQPIC